MTESECGICTTCDFEKEIDARFADIQRYVNGLKELDEVTKCNVIAVCMECNDLVVSLYNDAVQILKSLMKSLRDNANYFDEEHEYERMNELDKVYNVPKRLAPVIERLSDAKNEYESKYVEYGDVPYSIPMKDVNDLLEMIEYVKDMKPFGDRSE